MHANKSQDDFFKKLIKCSLCDSLFCLIDIICFSTLQQLKANNFNSNIFVTILCFAVQLDSGVDSKCLVMWFKLK